MDKAMQVSINTILKSYYQSMWNVVTQTTKIPKAIIEEHGR